MDPNMIRPPTRWVSFLTPNLPRFKGPKVAFREMSRGAQSLCHEYSPVSTYHGITW